ncbi:MAG: hypothetical protein A3F40_04300 [Chlamydiae bacterium RIFCSPHIGHO2_12_FULL_27_8]|nr:MAG: hypothetical protein A3F40_04300 [Chlamydiae bacterium RIFCSPHIGHO2_12_FULL_27_8]
MHQVHFIQKIYSKFFPQSFTKALKSIDIPDKWKNLNNDEKKKQSVQLLDEGEKLLSKNDLNAIKFFNDASLLDPTNPLIWYRQGLAFFDYGSNQNEEKAYHLASKNFKIAVSLDSEIFDFWWAWGNVLYVLSNKGYEYNYLQEAKKKYKHAIHLSKNQNDAVLSELYWDYALILTKISEHSGEAIDLKLAIESFQKSSFLQKDISAAFLYDFGSSYLKMGTLINEANIYLQAIDYFKLAVEKSKKYVDAWVSIAHSYTQLYINTLDEEYFNLACKNFETAAEINPLDSEIWLDYANILAESGKLNQDPKKLRASIEKCIKAYKRNKKNPEIIGTWVESLSLLGALTNRLDLILEAEKKIMTATDLYSEETDLWYSYGICQKAFGIYYSDIDYEYFAIEKYQIGLSIDRTSSEIWYELANSHSKIGKETDDIDMLERAIKFYSKSIDLKASCPSIIFEHAKALTYLGSLTLCKKTLEDAIKKFESALNIQKNAILSHPDWLYYYARALDLYGDLNETENYYLKAIEVFHSVLLVDPDFPKIHFRLALCYSHLLELSPKHQYFEKATHCFSLATRQDMEDQEVWLEWGLTLINFAYENNIGNEKNEYFFEAEQKILKAGRLGNQHAYYHLACLYSLTYRFDESINLLEKAFLCDMLPPIEEMLDDEWLDPLRETESFHQFLNRIEKKQNI